MGSDLNKLDEHVVTSEEYEELPELTEKDFERPDLAWRLDGRQVSEAEGKAAFRKAMKKQKINITLDADVLAWFKEQAGGRGYQTLINATLREAMQRKGIEEALRRVIREELHAA
ncbi:MAG: BrnA antitoxin family protein [Gammaproteobacteria bacterium]|nr:BrnA antitoxin family protein [Gammaproteobacteria bacterium]MBU1653540.1 BrnA antitoxin family protein [Gammaproteobacteria bacterium]MBU1961882.1 BrnA antitoxin family protein [Gammaproteobacteria bacterium]